MTFHRFLFVILVVLAFLPVQNALATQIAIVKTPDNGTFTQGSQVTYTIVVTAIGDKPAENVQVTDQLPTNGNLQWTSYTATAGSCTISSGSFLSCSLGTMLFGDSVTITVSSPPTTPDSACQPQPNPIAQATADNADTVQDAGSLTCTPPPPTKLTVVKTPDNGVFSQGGPVSFTIVVSNSADASPATNVVLNDQLPGAGGLVFTTVTPSQGTCLAIVNNFLSCALGTLAPGASATVIVSSDATTPDSACQAQDNPIAFAQADGGATAQDSGSVSCTPNNGKTFTIGPSSMEGAIKISNGDWVNGGYSFKFKSAHTATNFIVNASVGITGPCLSATGVKLGFSNTLTVPLGTITYVIPASTKATDWLPTGDANSVLSWQGAVQASGLCGGGGNQLDASKGAVFTATVSQNPPSGSLVDFRFKYRDPAAKGKPNTNCLDTSDPNRSKADVCGASWSQTVTDP